MFFEQLETLCKKNGTTPSTVARELGFSMGSVSRWRKGACPNSDIAVTFANHFGVTTDYLLKGDTSAGNTINGDISGVGVAGNVYGGTLQNVNNGSSLAADSQQQTISDEAAELLRVYNSLDVKKRMKLLEAAFSLEELRGEM